MARPGFRPDIEGLRAIAILLVVGYHAAVPGVGGGYVGVDVFFVLSGYLITGLLARELETSGRIDFARFYARRARRLLPAAALVLLATLIVGRFILSPIEMRELARTALATSIYASNLYFLRESTDYLAPASHENPLLHTWSLAVEEQFYLLWPLLIAAGFAMARAKRSRAPLMLLLGTVGAVSLLGSLRFTSTVQAWAFFGSPFRAWEFAAGGLAALLPKSHLPAGRTATLIGFIGLTAIIAGAVMFDETTSFPGSAALLPVIATTFTLLACARAPDEGVGRVLGADAMQRIGRLSYSWYLWHWPVLVYAAALGATGSLGWRIAWAALSLLLAHLTFRTVEDPVRHHRALLRPRLTAVTAVILTLSTVGCSQWWLSSAARAADRPDQRMFTTAYTDLPENYTRGCHVDVLSVEGQPCVFGDTAAEETVVLFGDSHAAQWLPAVERLAKTEGWRVLSLTKSECPAAAVELYSPRLGRRYDECTRWHRRTLQRIVELRPALVLASSSRAYPAADAHSPYRVTHAEWQEGTRRLVETLTSAGVRTVLIRDTPRPGIVIPTCLARASWSLLRRPGECQVSRDVAVDTIVSSLERAAIAGIDGAEIADLTDAICDEATCAPTQDGVVVFKDSNHLTAAFSRMMAPALGDALRGRGERITRHGQRSEAG